MPTGLSGIIPIAGQEQWVNGTVSRRDPLCVHTLRSFEESLLASMAGDVEGEQVSLRVASPSTKGFAADILGARDVEEAAGGLAGVSGRQGKPPR